MTILDILRYPDARLYQTATAVSAINDECRTLIDDLAETMYAPYGIGLAATQVDVHKQIIVVDVAESRDRLLAFVNPVILSRDGEASRAEGCLSVPGVFATIARAQRITVQALDRAGLPFSLRAEGLLAACIQHEIDHLRGLVFVNYLSPFKQGRLRHKLKKQARLSA